MAEILLSDYFAENGGANDDSADCTASFNAAVAALGMAGGGILELPNGVCRIAGKVFGAPYCPIVIKGVGNSVVKFMGVRDRRFEVTAQENILSFENITFRGETTTDIDPSKNYNATQCILWLKGSLVNMRNCRILALAVSGSGPEVGVVTVYQSNAHFELCQFSASAAPGAGVVRGLDLKSMSFKNCSFLDWQNLGADYYSKTPIGNVAWIRADDWHMEAATNYTRRLAVDECYFDEGTANAILMKGGDSAEIVGSGANFGTDCGYNFENVPDVRIRQTWCGYISTGNRVGVRAHNVGLLKLERLKLHNAVNHIELSGTTKRAILENCHLQGNETYPDGVKNTANALLEIDGVKYRNGMTAY
jgi:hypothetical protein